MTSDDIRQQIELKVVELIKDRLADGSMTEERSQQISQAVLDILTPGMTLEELYKAIPKLDDNATELSPVIVPILREYEQNIAQGALTNIRQFIKQGQYDAAATLSKNVINQDVKLAWGKGGV